MIPYCKNMHELEMDSDWTLSKSFKHINELNEKLLQKQTELEKNFNRLSEEEREKIQKELKKMKDKRDKFEKKKCVDCKIEFKDIYNQ